MKYFVSVGNIGNIDCKNLAEANKTYAEYVKQSKGKPTRVYQEDVVLFDDGCNIIKEFYYEQYKLERLETNVQLKQQEVDRARDILEEYKLEKGFI